MVQTTASAAAQGEKLCPYLQTAIYRANMEKTAGRNAAVLVVEVRASDGAVLDRFLGVQVDDPVRGSYIVRMRDSRELTMDQILSERGGDNAAKYYIKNMT